jgi:lipopolysaccharide/colanic/teichoic acid biosynthesis glycosyltransferase
MNYEVRIKNGIYTLFVVLLLVLTAPIFVFISLLLFITQGVPIVFQQKRTGLMGRIFTMYKFRTMKHGAEKTQKELTPLNEAHGPVFKIHNDPRFTRVGKFLAHTGLDESPQLINVIVGDMALIGPRPLPIEEAGRLTPWQRKREEIKPGIISPWIVEGYHSQTFDSWMKSDIAYIKKKSIGYDIHLAVRTVVLLIQFFFRELASYF